MANYVCKDCGHTVIWNAHEPPRFPCSECGGELERKQLLAMVIKHPETTKLIVRGNVVRDLTNPNLIILISDNKAEHWMLPDWARRYIDRTMIISLEEEKGTTLDKGEMG